MSLGKNTHQYCIIYSIGFESTYKKVALELVIKQFQSLILLNIRDSTRDSSMKQRLQLEYTNL